MFDFLRKKISSWIGKKPEKATKSKKAKKEKKVKNPTRVKEKKKNAKKASAVQTEQILEQQKPIEQTSELKDNNSTIKTASSPPEEMPEEPLEQSVLEEPEELPKENFFSRLVKKMTSAPLTNEHFEELFLELELTLLENNVALEAVDAIKENLSKNLVGKHLKKSDAESHILTALKDAILALLHEPPSLTEAIKAKKEPYVILFFGINGTGKTTSIAKFAHLLKKNNLSCVLAAADTFRAASIEQLKTHASRLDVPIVAHQYGTDPASVAFDAIAYAKKHTIKVVLIDTAGRMYTKDNLLKEMEKVVRVSKPDLKLFVGESITGNDAIDQARTFNDTIGIDGIILTKADIDEKAGTILSVSHVTQKPIYFLGTGQNYEDLAPFTKKTVLKNLGLE